MKRAIALTLSMMSMSPMWTPVAAHHSGSMFDDARQATIKGVIKQMQWTNPHCWLLVTASEAGADANPVVWSFEMGPPNVLARVGLRKADFKVGEKVVVHARPSKDGQPVALLVDVVMSDGKTLKP